MHCLPNICFVPNQPCGVLALADLHLPVSVANRHLFANVQTAVVPSIAVFMITERDREAKCTSARVFY